MVFKMNGSSSLKGLGPYILYTRERRNSESNVETLLSKVSDLAILLTFSINFFPSNLEVPNFHYFLHKHLMKPSKDLKSKSMQDERHEVPLRRSGTSIVPPFYTTPF